MPACLLDPLWDRFAPLLPFHPAAVPTHPFGCHRPRIPDRPVFEQAVAAPVHGPGYERIATLGCSDRTLRRRVHERAAAGLTGPLPALSLRQDGRLIGSDSGALAVDGCLTKAPCGGDTAGRSPVDRGEQGLQRSAVVAGRGVPRHPVSAGADRHAAPSPAPTAEGLAEPGPRPDGITAHPDRASDGGPTRALLDRLGFAGALAREGLPAPLRAGTRRSVERTRSWMTGSGKPRRCTERDGAVVDCSLSLAAAFVPARALIREARHRFRWDGRPTTRRLK